MANAWQKFVILRAGNLQGVKGPGLFFIVPILDKVTAVIDERIQTTAFSAEQALTKDTVPVKCGRYYLLACARRAEGGLEHHELPRGYRSGQFDALPRRGIVLFSWGATSVTRMFARINPDREARNRRSHLVFSRTKRYPSARLVVLNDCRKEEFSSARGHRP